MQKAAPVSFVVPVHNGAAFIRDTLLAILAQADGREIEVIVVDDRSTDGSAAIARDLGVRVLEGSGAGAAAAINRGLDAVRFPFVGQIDQDVVIGPGWLAQVTAALDDQAVAAVQGYYVADRDASLCARVMGLDLEHRYGAMQNGETSHVCTGNTVYRVEALKRVGLFDESLGYGYDNDMSYRLRRAGYRLVICPQARTRHCWRDGVVGYLRQQYGFGYGRLDLLAKHPTRFGGDSVSPASMMAHPILLALAVMAFVALPWLDSTGTAWRLCVLSGMAIMTGLILERVAAGIQTARQSGDAAALLFAPVHLLRDAVWIGAIGVWLTRRLIGLRSRPHHSMTARRGA